MERVTAGRWPAVDERVSARREAAADDDLGRAHLESLYRRTADRLWRYLRRVTGDDGAADEALQETYVRYLDRPSRSDDERSQSSYLFTIATNLLRDRWRRDERERRGLGLLAATRRGTAPSAPDHGARLDVDRALAALRPKERAMLWLAYVEGFDHREIASRLRLRPASVKVLLGRARRRLAAQLDRRPDVRRVR